MGETSINNIYEKRCLYTSINNIYEKLFQVHEMMEGHTIMTTQRNEQFVLTGDMLEVNHER